MEYCPTWYAEIEDKEACFTELGNEAQRQASSVYSKISKPELGQNDIAAWQMANETVNELIYPMPETGHEDGWEDLTETDLTEEELHPMASLNEFMALAQQSIDEEREEDIMAQLRRDFPDEYPALA